MRALWTCPKKKAEVKPRCLDVPAWIEDRYGMQGEVA